MIPNSFLRVAAACPQFRVADCQFNADRTLELLTQAERAGVNLAVFPETGLTGYTCGDLFHHRTLQADALDALDRLLVESKSSFSGVGIVGMPLEVDGRLFNVAVVFHNGYILGVVPKVFLPNYKEFYDARYFAPASAAVSDTVTMGGRTVPFGADLLFEASNVDGFVLGVEICEDLWMPIPPSSHQAIAGATVLANLSASNETIGKVAYRRQLVAGQSARCIAGYVYASCGPGESTTDLVFGGHCLIAETGTVLAESERFRRDGHLTIADVDLDHVQRDRVTSNTFAVSERDRTFRRVRFRLSTGHERTPALARTVNAHPFVPANPATLRDRCEEIFHTQVAGLAKRLDHIGRPPVAIGVSGGLDSTLALLVVCKTFDAIGASRSDIRAITMPGYGTTGRTKGNADALMAGLGVSAREVDIRQLALDEMKTLGHAPFGISLDGLDVAALAEKLQQVPDDKRHDLVFENVQARARTSLLMNTAFVVGTGDLSELALGWCTYNADHMSMYNPNASIPKTLVKFLVRWAAENEFDGNVRATLLDVADTEISPELLPTGRDSAPQSTEATVGPYELHDFFLYHFLRWATPPEKILFLAEHARFDREYSAAEVRKWLRVFLTRFFQNQFKRSAIPDGPKVGTVSLSPRGDWRMPSDAVARAWLDRIAD